MVLYSFYASSWDRYVAYLNILSITVVACSVSLKNSIIKNIYIFYNYNNNINVRDK